VDLSKAPKTASFVIRNLNIAKNKQQFDAQASYGNAIIDNGKASLFVPRSGTYELNARIRAVSNTTVAFSVDGNNIAQVIVSPTAGYQWVTFGNLTIPEGDHEISLDSSGSTRLDLVQIAGRAITYAPSSNPQLTFDRIDPTQYQVLTNETKPFFLIFMENYDPSWTVSVSDSLHLRAYALSNLYYISNPPPRLTLSYSRQFLFSIGLKISASVWVFMTVALVMPAKWWRHVREGLHFRRKSVLRAIQA
jgi:hypothetical protein